jgi:hypothetical protein
VAFFEDSLRVKSSPLYCKARLKHLFAAQARIYDFHVFGNEVPYLEGGYEERDQDRRREKRDNQGGNEFMSDVADAIATASKGGCASYLWRTRRL